MRRPCAMTALPASPPNHSRGMATCKWHMPPLSYHFACLPFLPLHSTCCCSFSPNTLLHLRLLFLLLLLLLPILCLPPPITLPTAAASLPQNCCTAATIVPWYCEDLYCCSKPSLLRCCSCLWSYLGAEVSSIRITNDLGASSNSSSNNNQ